MLEAGEIYLAGSVWQAGDHQHPCANWQEGVRQAFASLSTSSAGRRRWRSRPSVRVWLSGGLARPFVVGPVAGLKHWREAEALAEAAAFGTTGLEAPTRVFVEDWPGSAPALATAVETAVLEAVEAAAAAAGVRVASIRPWWAHALAQHARSTPALRMLAVVEPDALTAIAVRDEGFEFATTYVPRPAAENEAQILSRLRLTHSIADNEMASGAGP